MKDFLSELTNKNIHISLDKDELSIKFPKTDMDMSILEEIKSRKNDIIAYLNNIKKKAFVFIPALTDSKCYRISNAQRRLLILSQFEGGSAAFNMPNITYLERAINIECFKKAIDSTLERHEILRTIFKEDETGEIKQWVLEKRDLGFKIDYKDFRKEENKEGKVNEYFTEDSYKPFDLEKGPLLRASLLHLEDERYVFYHNMHHIISDGWSMEVLLRDVLSYYESYKENKEPSLEELRIQYKDYSAWQLDQLEKGFLKAHRDYWLASLSGELPVLDLPSTKQRPRIKTNNGYVLSTYINSEITTKLKAYSKENGGSLFIGLLASWNILMYRYTSQTDIIIGTPVAGREHANLEDQIGFYVNTLALRNQINPEESFNAFYKVVKDNTLNSFSHQVYPFDRIVEELNLLRDTGRSPVFDIALVLQNNGEKIGEVELSVQELNRIADMGTSKTKFDIDIAFQELGDYLALNIAYNPEVYEKEMIESLIIHYKQLLHALLEDPEEIVSQIDYLSQEEKHRMLFTFNDTKFDYPKDKTIVELFEEQVQKNPNNIALVFEEKKLTYQELNEKSTQLAYHLQENYNLCNEDIVGIQLHRSELLIISILGILKAGGAYVSIDPDYPVSRKQQIIDDTSLKLLITEASFVLEIDYYEGSIFAIDVELEEVEYSSPLLKAIVNMNNLACVIYTSGSTGTPKGVMVEQRSVVRLVKSMNFMEVFPKDKIFALSNFSFDASTFDIFMPLLNGGELIISSKDIFLNLNKLNKIIDEQNIDSFFVTTVLFNSLVDAKLKSLGNLKYLLFGGEQVSVNHVKKFKELYPDVKLRHLYGPSENTVLSTWYAIDIIPVDVLTIPIGSAISNSTIYILDEQRKIVPIGVIGEIYTGGDGLARGYLNQPDLTKEKFISNPFKSGEKLYKTGDLGRWLSDGNIEFVGRKDDQVKIRGYRIELGEIEHALLKHPQIEMAVIVAKKVENGEKEIVAYIKAHKEQNSSDLRSYLKGILPDYMLPAYYVKLDAFPLTSNGKVDKKALPDPYGLELESGIEYVAPSNETEENLVKIWQEVLQKQNIGIDDDLFVLGGDSIKAVQISAALKRNGVKITVTDIYNNITVRKLSAYINNKSVKYVENKLTEAIIPDFVYKSIPISVEDVYQLSDMQRIMIEEYEKDKEGLGIYHTVAHWRFIDNRFSIHALERATMDLQLKNQVLRTVFFSSNNELYQCIKKIDKTTLTLDNISNLNEKEQNDYIANCINLDVKNKFKINNWSECFARFKVFILSENKFEFMVSIHHSIIDGWGDTVFRNELMEHYLNYRDNKPVIVNEIPNSFKEYILLCKEVSDSKQANEFWWNELKDFKPFKKDRIKLVDSFVTKEFYLDKKLGKKLKKISEDEGVTLKAVFLLNYIKTLSIILKTMNLSIGVVFNGRTAELSDPFNSLGLFWNMLPFNLNSIEYISSKIVQDKLNKCEEFSRFSSYKINQRFEGDPNLASFNYTHFHNSKTWKESEINKLELPQLIGGGGIDIFHYPLNLGISVSPNDTYSILLLASYNQAFFSDEEMDRILNEYVKILEEL